MPHHDVRLSKFLSRHLRHAPHELGLTLQPGGWVRVDDLLDACARRGVRLSWVTLRQLVADNDKQRFSFDDTGERIRANQGHSVTVDLQLEDRAPPAVLYHGTGAASVAAVLATGLDRRARHDVHLSTDVPTATKVGARHGKPVVLVVDAARMHADGHTFRVSDNGVWLTEAVPPAYLRVL